jgi:hypothetical protein
MRIPRFIATIAVAVLSFGLVGATASAAKEKPLSKADYIAAADQICDARNEKLTDQLSPIIGNTPDSELTSQQIKKAVKVLVTLTRKELKDIEALAEPTADRAQVKKILKATRAALDRVERNPSELVKNPEVFTKGADLAVAYGFEVCGHR